MGLLDNLRAMFAPRAYRLYPAGPVVSVADMSIAQLYRTQPNLRAVVGYLADNAAQIPWKVYERADENDRIRLRDTPAALLLAHPNPDMTAYELKRRIFADLYLYDRHLSIVAPDAETESGWQMRPIPATWICGYEGTDPFAPEAVYISNPTGRRIAVPKDRMILFHGYSPDDIAGNVSPVEALADVLHEQVESNSFRRQMWRNGGRFNAYIRRPAEVEDWTDEQFERFRQSWDESWAGRSASKGGSMPILEDGMEIRTVPFSAHDAEWSTAKKLGREDVAAVYHINPALVWPGEGQTYASAKENARALYNDTLAPTLMQVVERINAVLLPLIGEPRGDYVEFDLSVKLQGSFEERAQVVQSAVGGPWMTRDEVRAMFNLPHIDGADELIVPLNVIEGGLASPRDTDPTIDRNADVPLLKEAEHGHGCGCAACKADASATFKAVADDEAGREMADTLRAFYARQRKSVLPKIGADPTVPDEGDPRWWDSERWNRELTDDLEAVALKQSESAARRAIAALGIDGSSYSVPQTRAFINSMAYRRACMANDATLRELEEVIADEESERTPADVFDVAESKRSENGGFPFAASIASWSALEAVRQCAPRRGATKTWEVTSGNPRASHAAMDGETVPYGEKFSNGAMWPGDADALGPEEVANCQCAVTITIP